MGCSRKGHARAQRGSTARFEHAHEIRTQGLALAIAKTLAVRGDVCLVRLDPTLGSEIRKTRPCLVVSPDELNQHLRTVIVAPMTTGGHAYPWRIACRFQNRSGFVALDQIRTVDSDRLVKRLGRLSSSTTSDVMETLQEMFTE